MGQENKSFLIGLLCALAVGISVAVAGLMPRTDAMVLVVGNPLSSERAYTIVSQANGRFIYGFSSPSMGIAVQGAEAAPTFVSDLYENGAFLVLDAAGFLACFNPKLLSRLQQNV